MLVVCQFEAIFSFVLALVSTNGFQVLQGQLKKLRRCDSEEPHPYFSLPLDGLFSANENFLEKRLACN